jgi:hypothetical protein
VRAGHDPEMLLLCSEKELWLVGQGNLHRLVDPHALPSKLRNRLARADFQAATNVRTLNGRMFASCLRNTIPTEWQGKPAVPWITEDERVRTLSPTREIQLSGDDLVAADLIDTVREVSVSGGEDLLLDIHDDIGLQDKPLSAPSTPRDGPVSDVIPMPTPTPASSAQRQVIRCCDPLSDPTWIKRLWEYVADARLQLTEFAGMPILPVFGGGLDRKCRVCLHRRNLLFFSRYILADDSW